MNGRAVASEVVVTNEVQQAYQQRWGKDVTAEVLLIEPASDGGKWVSVQTLYPGGKQLDEVCHVDRNGRVRVFETTPDLVRFLAGTHSWERRFFAAPVVGAIAFLATLAAVIAVTLLNIGNERGVEALAGLLILAAGFYFGNQTGKS